MTAEQVEALELSPLAEAVAEIDAARVIVAQHLPRAYQAEVRDLLLSARFRLMVLDVAP